MFVDTHCHLCPGLDDGPKNMDEALAMCQIAWQEGIRTIAALAHQNETWPDVTPDAIRDSVQSVRDELTKLDCPIELVPWSEVMIGPDTLDQFDTGKLLTISSSSDYRTAETPKHRNTDLPKHRSTEAPKHRYILLEQPHTIYLDMRRLAQDLIERGVRPVIAHADRYPELLRDTKQLGDLVRIGSIIQLSTEGITDATRATRRTLRDWVRRGFVHVVGTDAHSPRRRRPMMAAAYEQLRTWTDEATARLICSTNGTAILSGNPIQTPKPQPVKKRPWYSLAR